MRVIAVAEGYVIMNLDSVDAFTDIVVSDVFP